MNELDLGPILQKNEPHNRKKKKSKKKNGKKQKGKKTSR